MQNSSDFNIPIVRGHIHGKKLKYKTKNSKLCCTCQKSHCLKKYCECFAANKYCETCTCLSCKNTVHYRTIPESNYNSLSDNFASPDKKVSCTCTKSGCKKNYCDCFKAGIKCGELCRCLDCKNNIPHNHKNKHDSIEDLLVIAPYKMERISVSVINNEINFNKTKLYNYNNNSGAQTPKFTKRKTERDTELGNTEPETCKDSKSTINLDHKSISFVSNKLVDRFPKAESTL